MIVGIDAMVVIYAELVPAKDRDPPPSEEELARLADLKIRAKMLLYTLNREKATIVLPVVAITELLVPVPKAQKGEVLAELDRLFWCRPHDPQSSAISSDLWARYKQLPQDMQYSDRNVLKSDAYIVGCAVAAGATKFYSHDKNCRTMAGLVIDASDLPTRPPDGDMFLMNDIRDGIAAPPFPEPTTTPKSKER